MNHSYRVFLGLAALAALGAAPAAAQDVNNDVRCLMVSNAFAKTVKDEKGKEVANAARLFYGGRVSAFSNAQIEAGLRSQQKQVNAANAATTMNACAQSMERALKNIQTVSQKLQAPKG